MEPKKKPKTSQKVPKFGQKFAAYDPQIAEEKAKEHHENLMEFLKNNLDSKNKSLDKQDDKTLTYNEDKNKFLSNSQQKIENYEALDLLTRGKCKLSDSANPDSKISDEVTAFHLLPSSADVPLYIINSSLRRQSHKLTSSDSGDFSISTAIKNQKSQVLSSASVVSSPSISISELSKFNGVVFINSGSTFIPLKIQTLPSFIH